MLFRLALLEGGAEERLSAGFGRRQPATASLSAAGPVPESGASSQKWQAAGRQNAAFGQILGAGAFKAAGKPCPTGCGTALPSGQPGRTAPRDSREGARIGQKLLPGQEFPISIHAPREGSDLHHVTQHSKIRHFYPHSPQGERPAPRPGRPGHRHFYPRSPGGERRMGTSVLIWPDKFLSTLPARGTTTKSNKHQRWILRKSPK